MSRIRHDECKCGGLKRVESKVCSQCRFPTKGKREPIVIDPKWLVRGNISSHNRVSSIEGNA